MRNITMSAVFIVTLCSMELGFAGPTRVGNGDDGGDLESLTPVSSGALVEARDEAVQLLRRLDVATIEGLGQLIPETEKADLMLADADDPSQPVFARTFPEPHAATRFFPAALKLSRKQQVALHIHEALHRALPKNIRENEEIVSRITLALTSEGASFDRVKNVVIHELRTAPAPSEKAAQHGGMISTGPIENRERLTDESPSYVEYKYRSFFLPKSERSISPVSSLHSLKIFNYPFGPTLGLGVEFSFVILPQRSYMGPVGLTGRLNLAQWKKSELDLFGDFHLNTVADGEIKNTPVGRDLMTIGLAVRRNEQSFRVENEFYYTASSEAKQRTETGEVTHKYGSIFGARVVALGKSPLSAKTSIEWGGVAEVMLANPHEVQGVALQQSSSRLRLVSIGPEVRYVTGDWKFTLNGRFVVDSTEGVSLDQIGDLMGHGMGQGSLGAAATWRF